MVFYNKYLKEIGIKKTDYPFVKEDERYLPNEEGFVLAEFFNLDICLTMYIYSHLCYFKDNCLIGHPGFLTFEKWEKIIDEMILAFKLLLTENSWKLSKRKERKINKGLRNFTKYYRHLWY